jgi:hypothetical protein
MCMLYYPSCPRGVGGCDCAALRPTHQDVGVLWALNGLGAGGGLQGHLVGRHLHGAPAGAGGPGGLGLSLELACEHHFCRCV